MVSRKSRSRSLCFEKLERRETPSTVFPSQPHITPLAAVRSAPPFDATATAVFIEMPSDQDQSFVSSVTGRASRVGAFTGQLFAATQNQGAQVEFDMKSKRKGILDIEMAVLVPNGGDTTVDFQGIYAISGGTKRFKGATGGGAVNGIAYNQGQFLMFTLHGKIAP